MQAKALPLPPLPRSNGRCLGRGAFKWGKEVGRKGGRGREGKGEERRGRAREQANGGSGRNEGQGSEGFTPSPM